MNGCGCPSPTGDSAFLAVQLHLLTPRSQWVHKFRIEPEKRTHTQAMSTQIQGRARKEESYTPNEYTNSGLTQKRGLIRKQWVHKFRIEPEKRNHTHSMSTQIQGRARKEDSYIRNEYSNLGLSQKRGLIRKQWVHKFRIEPEKRNHWTAPLVKAKSAFSVGSLSACRSWSVGSAFLVVQLHRPTPRPEQIPRKSQNRTFPVNSYLSVGANRVIPHFFLSSFTS
jgi:hypothetical protein